MTNLLAMEVQNLLRMKEGVGQDSYANNSHIQKSVTAQAKSVLEETIKEAYRVLKPKCFMIADMGCSSGPNALFAVSEIINAIDKACRSLNCQAPEFGVFLNDLLGNDFNTLFNFVQGFYKWVEEEKGRDFGPCFVSGTPKSFYGRVFPDSFLHFVYSSCALHWLSQVPEGLVSDQGVGLNRGNIMVGRASPLAVQEAYHTQFKKDFTMFLRSRAKEVVAGGCMVLTFPASIPSTHPHVNSELLGSTLRDMVLEGMIDEGKLDKFNIPLYLANAEEVRQLVEAEGSFVLNKLETFTVDWSSQMTQDVDNRAEFLARFLRATCESVLATAFGEAIMDDFFFKLKMKISEHIGARQPVEYMNCLLVSVTRKLED